MDKVELEQLLKRHHRDAFLWAYQICNYNDDDGKEVLQMTYLKIAEGRAVFRDKSEFKTWLFSIIRNTAMDYLKKRVFFDDLDTIEEKFQEVEKIDTDPINYRDLLQRLPNRQQQVLLLAFYHDMTLAQIADVTNLHIGTVRTHYERGKIAVKALIINEKK